jgi:hypothetical protein
LTVWMFRDILNSEKREGSVQTGQKRSHEL